MDLEFHPLTADRWADLVALFGPNGVNSVSVSPRSEYVRLLRSPVHEPVNEESDVWAIARFFSARNARGTGVADAPLEAAVHYARDQGVGLVESYPIDTSGERRAPAEDRVAGASGRGCASPTGSPPGSAGEAAEV